MLPSTSDGDGGGASTGIPTVQEEEEEIDMRLALKSDPIVGTDLVISDSNGPGALTPKPLSTPHSMTPREKAIHNLTYALSSGMRNLCCDKNAQYHAPYLS